MNALSLWADFNVFEGDTVWTSLTQTKDQLIPNGHPVVGEWVELWDYDGDRCLGVVTKVTLPIVWVKLDMRTWLDGHDPRHLESAPFSHAPAPRTLEEAEVPTQKSQKILLVA